MNELEKRIREILHEEGLRNIPLQNETRKIGEIMEALQIEAFIQLIQQERIKAQEEVINKIVGLLFDKNGYFRKGSHPLLSELDELKQSLAEKEEK